MEWDELSWNARYWMDKLGSFGPIDNKKAKTLKGSTLSEYGEGVKTYWTSQDLRDIADACTEVADWLDKRAEI